MSITGTIIDGQVMLDGPMQWPDGTPVTLTQRMDRWPRCDEAAELAILRKSIADMRAGENGQPFLEVFEEISREMDLPTLPAE